MHLWKETLCDWIVRKLAPGRFLRAYEICTDGSHNPAHGAGGWAFSISRGQDAEPFFCSSGSAMVLSSHHAECLALEMALKWVAEHSELELGVIILSIDCDPVSIGFFEEMRSWERQLWKSERENRAQGGNVRLRITSVILWENILFYQRKLHKRGFCFKDNRIRSHSGHSGNHRVDKLAKSEMRRLNKRLQSGQPPELEAAE